MRNKYINLKYMIFKNKKESINWLKEENCDNCLIRLHISIPRETSNDEKSSKSISNDEQSDEPKDDDNTRERRNKIRHSNPRNKKFLWNKMEDLGIEHSNRFDSLTEEIVLMKDPDIQDPEEEEFIEVSHISKGSIERVKLPGTIRDMMSFSETIKEHNLEVMKLMNANNDLRKKQLLAREESKRVELDAIERESIGVCIDNSVEDSVESTDITQAKNNNTGGDAEHLRIISNLESRIKLLSENARTKKTLIQMKYEAGQGYIQRCDALHLRMIEMMDPVDDDDLFLESNIHRLFYRIGLANGDINEDNIHDKLGYPPGY